MELNASPTGLSLAPLSAIKRNLDRLFTPGKWEGYEVETISMELGYALDELLRDKIGILQNISNDPNLFTDDVLFFLHAVDVINNNIANFDHFPMPTSLEVAYAYEEVQKLFPVIKMNMGSGVKKAVTYILTLEGYSEPVWPFNSLGVVATDLSPGQTPEDTRDKARAIHLYIERMSRV